MIPRQLTVYVATAPVDMRLSFDRLAGIVRDQLQTEPRGDVLVVFHNRRRTHLKLLWHDGGGYCVLYKLDTAPGCCRRPRGKAPRRRQRRRRPSALVEMILPS